MIFVGVDNYKNNPHDFGKYFGILLAIPVFILCGFEHCIANMYYFSVADAWNCHTLQLILLMTLGTSIGGNLFAALVKLSPRLVQQVK